MEMRHDWRKGAETIFETSFSEKLENVPKGKKPIEKWSGHEKGLIRRYIKAGFDSVYPVPMI